MTILLLISELGSIGLLSAKKRTHFYLYGALLLLGPFSSCSFFEGRFDGQVFPSQKQKETVLKRKESQQLVGYQLDSPNQVYSFNVFAAKEPTWDTDNPNRFFFYLDNDSSAIQCSFSREREPLNELLKRVEAAQTPLGVGELRVGSYRNFPYMYVEKLYASEAEEILPQVVKMIGVDLDKATLFCLHRGRDYKESFFTALEEIGKTVEVRLNYLDKNLKETYVWELRFDNYPRGLIIERLYERSDGLQEIFKEQLELKYEDEKVESFLEQVVQLKDPQREGSLLFFKGSKDGKRFYELALKREGINAYLIQGQAYGKPVKFQIDSNQKVPNLNEEREALARKIPSFKYPLFSPRYNPIALSYVEGNRFGDPTKECLYLLKKPEGIFEVTCDSSGRILHFFPKQARLDQRYSGRLIYRP